VVGGGNTVMYFIGMVLFLILIYLFVAGKGATALGGIVNVVTGAVGTFISPTTQPKTGEAQGDPIKALEKALGATPIGGTSPTPAASSGSVPSGSSPEPAPTAPGAPPILPPILPPSQSKVLPNVLTWPALQRAIKAHKLTPAQVRADIRSLQSGHPAWAPAPRLPRKK
jgi:hypothetical protein